MKSSESFWKRLQRPRYRRAFVAANVGVQIAAQLLALRMSRGKSQEKLAEEIGMNQARISLMERPDYRKYNVTTLMRFAEYYDVALDVRFVPIKEQVRRLLNQSSAEITPPPFKEGLAVSRPTPNVQQVVMAFKDTHKEQPSLRNWIHRDIKPSNILLCAVNKQPDERQAPPVHDNP